MLEKFLIGNAENTELGTGVTVILSPTGAVGGVSVRGKAPATRETDLLKSENSVEKVNAIVLSGGSAFGLEASSGVMEYLHEKGFGYDAGAYKVPIVSGASLFDLEYKAFAYPDKKMGYIACQNAVEIKEISGNIGAGSGATVGKVMGMKFAGKGGLGVVTSKMGKLEMSAVVAVNAFGNVYKKDSNEFLSGCTLLGKNINIEESILKFSKLKSKFGNTTIGCIVTNAKLTKSQCNGLADSTHDAFARCIKPVHTAFDGDCIFAISSGEVEANFVVLQTLATELMCKAIEKAVS